MQARIEQHMNEQSPEAAGAGICHTEQECLQMYKDMPSELKAPALEMLRTELAPVIGDITRAYASDPTGWYVSYHFGWGMNVRNLLREKGFGEEYFKVHNLDDIYIPLVEEALSLKEV